MGKMLDQGNDRIRVLEMNANRQQNVVQELQGAMTTNGNGMNAITAEIMQLKEAYGLLVGCDASFKRWPTRRALRRQG